MNNDIDMKDIILNGDHEMGDRNIKKILTIIAILVVIFLMVLAIMKIINKSSRIDDDIVATTTQQQVEDINNKANSIGDIKFEEKLKPDTRPTQTVVVSADNSDRVDRISTKIDNITNQNSETAKTEIKPVEVKHEEKNDNFISNPTTQNIVAKNDSSHVDLKKVEKPETKKTETKKPESKTVEKKPDISQKVEKKVETKKHETKKVEPKPETKKDDKKSNTTPSSIKKGQYVQVLATSSFSKESPQIKKLIEKKYEYHLYPIKVNGKNLVKVLVGPFDNSRIKEVLKDIKSDINKNAFIYMVK